VKIVYTKHALEKFKKFEVEGWIITKNKIYRTIKKPTWKGLTTEGQETAMSLIDPKHIIRVVIRREEDDIIVAITFHLGKRGKYGSTL